MRNFTTVNVGKLNEIKEYELAMGNFSIPGKMFAGHALQATGAELSFQSLAAGQDYGTRHAHKTHEELYFILKGDGIFDVDGKRFPVSEGSNRENCAQWQTCFQEHRQQRNARALRTI